MILILLITFLLILTLGVLYGVVLRSAPRDGTAWRAAATTSLLVGFLAAVLTALAGLLSFTSLLEAMPLAMRFGWAGFLGFPAALVGMACGAFGLKSTARGQASAGLLLSAACVVLWTVMAVVVY